MARSNLRVIVEYRTPLASSSCGNKNEMSKERRGRRAQHSAAQEHTPRGLALCSSVVARRPLGNTSAKFVE